MSCLRETIVSSRQLVQALAKSRGAYGIAVMCIDYPDMMVGARRGSPLVVGIGEDANFIASDASAFVGRAKEAVFLKDGELAILRGSDFRITNQEGTKPKRLPSPSSRHWRKWNWEILVPTWKKKSLNNLPHCEIP